jgi:arylsulfatase A-like enzyme
MRKCTERAASQGRRCIAPWSLLLSFALLLLPALTSPTLGHAQAPSAIAAQQGFALTPQDKIVLIVVDTLRADHLPFYGYPKDTAPFLSQIAQKAVVFERAFSGSSRTAPAMASVFTSMYPSQHGVTTGLLATHRIEHSQEKKAEVLQLVKIPEAALTLGEVAQRAGLRTLGAADNMNIGSDQGFTAGFEHFDTSQDQGAEKLTAAVRQRLQAVKDQRYFLYLHYMDPHWPYTRHEKWVDTKEPRKRVAAYDSEIRHTDYYIEQLFKEFSWDQNTLLVFMADHGEEFGDHGKSGHGKTLYPEVTHVPLLIYHPRLNARRVSSLVHTIDVLPTLAELLKQSAEPYWQGKSLLPLFAGNATSSRRVFSELLRRDEPGREEKRALLEGSSIYIKTYAPKPREELYDLATDPRAGKNLATMPHLEMLPALQSALREHENQSPPFKEQEIEVTLDPETIQQLKTLGYMR